MSELEAVVVRSPSRRGETAQVVRALAHIALWSAAIMIASNAARLAGPPRDGLAIDEVAFGALPSDDQREFRAVLEGAGEAEDVRARSGGWPTVEALAARHIPPFAADPIDRAGYQWKLLRDGTVINYVGTPDPVSKRPTIVLVIVEPDPGMANDPSAPTDETHHRLNDGTMLHVMIWIGPRTIDGTAPPSGGGAGRGQAPTIDSPLAAPRLEDGWHRVTTVVGGARA